MKFEYKNHDGAIKTYEISPIGIEFAKPFHAGEPEWLLKGLDVKKNEEVHFVLKNIQRMIDEKVQRFLCVTVYVRNDQGKFLMIRSQKFDRWIPPGGKVECHETPDEAALRECLEETGVHIELVGKRSLVDGGLMRPYGSQLNKINPQREHVDLIYLGKPIQEQSLKRCKRETSDIGWFALNEIETLKTFPSILTWTRYFAALK